MGLRVEGVLDVALAHNAQVADDLDGRVAQHVVLVVVERLAGRHHDGFSSVDAQGVNVLHVAHLSEEQTTGQEFSNTCGSRKVALWRRYKVPLA